ncbi:MAG: ABC transporter ATP-binding protein [Halobacteriovoraceae bacterium]|nr:ABC transporter [Halobacteriovorax sp.]MCR9204087.1 ABC transporter ATP-binding protein [Halobacteriovoraceae bacterium]|tara:strand:- start:4770 stop:5702 length:933 start_codon:yes stop_codon:yes gene_type:complete
MSSDANKAVLVSHLLVQFGEFKAVNDISFSVDKGEIFGFLGANGAGKTTSIRVICGLLKPTAGEVSVGGEVFKGNGDNLKKKVGYMSQKFTLYDDLTVAENLEFTASLRKLDQDYFEERKKYLLDFIQFEYSEKSFVRDLSGGIKQQVALVASLLHDPEVIFLDEPTAGVTPVSRALFWSLIQKLADHGKTVFVTSHYMDEVEHCHRIALMRGGEIIALDTPKGLKSSQFPYGIYQLTAKAEDITDIEKALQRSSEVESFQPHGIHYHLAPKKDNSWEKISPLILPRFTAKKIRPSLEDVFIKLVEGKNR